jgi:glutaconate CoA-transferase subunit A
MVDVPARGEKVTRLAEAAAVGDGSSIAFGGFWYQNQPAAYARELVRRGVRGLVVSGSPVGGYVQDLLIGTGVAARLRTPHVSFDDEGLSPNLRHCAEAGSLVVEELDEAVLVGALRGALEALPALPVRSLRASAIAERSPLVRRSHGRLSEREAIAFVPDVAVLHVARADCHGNGVHGGPAFADRLLARTARRVVLTAERLVSNEEIRSDPQRTTIPGFLVDEVIIAPGGAGPGACHGVYEADHAALSDYIAAGERRRRGEADAWDALVEDITATAEEGRGAASDRS